jgi:plastocyanin
MKKILLIVVFALTLTACSSNKATLNVTATDQGFDSSTYTVPAGAEVTVNFTNNGAEDHSFIILKRGEHVTPPFQTKDEDKILWYIVARPGETKSGTFRAPTEPGEYDTICPVPGDIELRIKATLVVKEK